MHKGDLFAEPAPKASAEPPIDRAAPSIERIARQFVRRNGIAPLPTRVTASLRRMDPARFSSTAGVLVPVLIRADLMVEKMSDERLRRWAVIVHAVALLTGTGGAMAHGRRSAGRVIHEAGYSELRFMRLLAARDAALEGQVIRLARFLAAKGAGPLDLVPLADLVLCEGRAEDRAEAARLRLARGYYAAEAVVLKPADPPAD